MLGALSILLTLSPASPLPATPEEAALAQVAVAQAASAQAPAAGPAEPDAAVAEVTLGRRLFAGTVAGFGAGASLLLSLPLTVPLIYLGPLLGVSPLLGALLVVTVVPIALAAGSGLAASLFHSGIGPFAVGGATAAVGGLVTLIAGAVLSPQTPDPSRPEFHVGVLSLLGVPTLAAAGVAFCVAPFFVEPPAQAAEIE